jgi:magnesium-transporting ATPase (P-type)
MLAFINKELQESSRPEKSYEDFKNKHKLLKMFPFNSDTKKMTVVIELEHEKKVRVYTKGASENIIDDCAYI